MAIGELVRSGERTGSKVRIEPPNMITADANEAVAGVAYRASEMIAVYPITPSSPMGEWADEWATKARPNFWDNHRVLSRCRAKAARREHCTVRFRQERWQRPSLRHRASC